MAEQLGRTLDLKSGVTGSSPALAASWSCFSIALNNFNSSATLVNNQLAWDFNHVMFNLNFFFRTGV